jgi:hypothetical protein
MFNIFRKKKPSIIVATLNARLQPIHRADIEDALDDAMAKHGHGVRVVGGGTLMADNGEVSECDIEIELDTLSDALIDTVARTLEAMLAPKGSRIFVPDQGRQIDFGVQEGLALYLNGTDLPDDVYENHDSNHVYAECQRLLEGIGDVSSHWQGPTETALYMYGTGFEAMRDRIMPFVESYPVCQKCRIVQIA